jgi:hypothetical protein
VHARVIQVLGNNSSLFRPVQKKGGIGSLLETQGTPHLRRTSRAFMMEAN